MNLIDPSGRRITYLRISVTDRCNYRCIYCMPQEGIVLKNHGDMLSYEQITAVAREASACGISKIKVTGGEPLVRRDIETLIRKLAAIPGINDLGMTTNGSLLTRQKACDLKKAGLMRVNISLDTLNPNRFATITRGGKLEEVIAGIDAAQEAGLVPVKINMIIFNTTLQDEINAMSEFCAGRGLCLQTISHFTLGNKEMYASTTTDRPTSCSRCNRLRLTADGCMKPCLFSDTELRVDFKDIRASIVAAVAAKPGVGIACTNRTMSQIGG
ncbi:MAG: radical SAM protein [Chitinivibrionales bacterium]|nr:radical SAM protein [Chitinivibrionales bacterium]